MDAVRTSNFEERYARLTKFVLNLDAEETGREKNQEDEKRPCSIRPCEDHPKHLTGTTFRHVVSCKGYLKRKYGNLTGDRMPRPGARGDPGASREPFPRGKESAATAGVCVVFSFSVSAKFLQINLRRMKGNGGGLRPSEIQTAGDKKCYLQLLSTPARSLSIISTGRSYAPLPRAIGIIIRDNNSGINRRRGHSCRKFSKHRLQDIRTSFCQYTLCQFLQMYS